MNETETRTLDFGETREFVVCFKDDVLKVDAVVMMNDEKFGMGRFFISASYKARSMENLNIWYKSVEDTFVEWSDRLEFDLFENFISFEKTPPVSADVVWSSGSITIRMFTEEEPHFLADFEVVDFKCTKLEENDD